MSYIVCRYKQLPRLYNIISGKNYNDKRLSNDICIKQYYDEGNIHKRDFYFKSETQARNFIEKYKINDNILWFEIIPYGTAHFDEFSSCQLFEVIGANHCITVEYDD